MQTYDILIIELQKNGNCVASCSIDKSNLDVLMYNQKTELSDILSDMIYLLEDKISDNYHNELFGIDTHLNHKGEDIIN